jgi:peptidylprolyl isomerase
MATKTKPKNKGARQQAVRRARIAAAEDAARRHNRRNRRMLIAAIGVPIVVLVAGGIVATTVVGGGSKAKASTGDCVAMTDDPPLGAPYVPVHVGPAPTTLVTEELRAGTGPAVQPGDTITVDYVGVNCTDGKIFDSSYSRGQPASKISLNDVIPGWQQGIPGMQVGGQRMLGIPPALAYGDKDVGAVKPNSTLWFVVELKSIDGHASTATSAPAESVPAEPGATDTTSPATTPPPSS